MKNKVLSSVKKYNMISGGKVLVGLSGGSDSVSLLHILYSLKDELNIQVEAAHINHQIRGDDADNDEAFCKSFCESLGVKFYVLHSNVPEFAKENGMTLEEAGRKIRYDFFKEVCPDGVIATAHNLNDRIETFIFNFTRGSSLKGLCSVPPVRENIIRPLIDCSKDEIIQYCIDNSLSYCTDKTNYDTAYSRNRIRHNVISELKEINSSFEKSALHCIDLLNIDEDYLLSQAFEAYNSSICDGGYSIKSIYPLHPAIRNRVIIMILVKETGFDVNSSCVSDINEAIDEYFKSGRGMNIQLPGNMFIRTRAGKLEFPNEISSTDDIVVLNEGKNNFGNYTIDVKVTPYINSSQLFDKKLSVLICDYDKIQGNLFSRKRKSDDSISVPGRNITKSLRKLQNEKGIPPEIRDSIPVIADERGLIGAYLCGIDKRTAVNKETKNLIIFEIIEGIDNDK